MVRLMRLGYVHLLSRSVRGHQDVREYVYYHATVCATLLLHVAHTAWHFRQHRLVFLDCIVRTWPVPGPFAGSGARSEVRACKAMVAASRSASHPRSTFSSLSGSRCSRRPTPPTAALSSTPATSATSVSTASRSQTLLLFPLAHVCARPPARRNAQLMVRNDGGFVDYNGGALGYHAYSYAYDCYFGGALFAQSRICACQGGALAPAASAAPAASIFGCAWS